MPDNKDMTNGRDSRDRKRVAGEQDYEVDHFVREAGITREQARELVKRYGNNREKLLQQAKNLTRK